MGLGVGGYLMMAYPTLGWGGVRLSIDFPPPGAILDQGLPFTLVAGWVQTDKDLNLPYQVILVLDTSGSTSLPSGLDLDNDGIVGETPPLYRESQGLLGRNNTDPDDSILAAEVLIGQRFLDLLDPEKTRVGLVVFAGDFALDGYHSNLETPDASLESPLTPRYKELKEALTRIGLRGAFGGTNIAAGIRCAIAALAGSRSSKKLIVLLSDGPPTFPVGSGNIADPEDKILALSAAHLAYYSGIRIDVWAIGPRARERSFTLREIARVTKGHFVPLRRPEDLIQQLGEIRFVEIEGMEIKNLTLGRAAQQSLLTPDGFFIAKVPLVEGLNRIKARAWATDGSTREKIIPLYWYPGGSLRQLDLDLDLTTHSLISLRHLLQLERERIIRSNRERLQLELKITR